MYTPFIYNLSIACSAYRWLQDRGNGSFIQGIVIDAGYNQLRFAVYQNPQLRVKHIFWVIILFVLALCWARLAIQNHLNDFFPIDQHDGSFTFVHQLWPALFVVAKCQLNIQKYHTTNRLFELGLACFNISR